jgi:cysteine desulfurase/selenocysteine lyase
MVREVSFQDASWNDLPWKFESGTPPIAEGIGLSAAVDFLRKVGMDSIRVHEKKLLAHAYKRLSSMKGVSVYGPVSIADRSGVLAFNVKGIHPHDVAAWLNENGVAVRAGHHCAMPLSKLLGIPSSSRLSVGLYNTKEEIDALVESLVRAQHVFGGKKS